MKQSIAAVLIALAFVAILVVGVRQWSRSTREDNGSSQRQTMTEFRTQIRTALANPSMEVFCDSLRGLSNGQVLSALAAFVGPEQAKANGLDDPSAEQTDAVTVIREECAAAFGP